ncbi:MAG TPA: alpha/beta hydrolase [Noviherbaspirillum sp.]|nr:alpha/beta hydrolase [Noviherbaspirillum sp.]
MLKTVIAGDLEIAYQERGSADAPAVILLHGFPYDIHGYDEVATQLAPSARVIVPYLRGFGPTRFLSAATMRSGQQAAIAHDLLALMDALSIPSAVLAGYDWGARAACIVAALWPQRVDGLVTGGGYQIQDIAAAAHPLVPDLEHRLWYQYYFHGERGRAGLAANRFELGRLLWQQWSPSWAFSDETYAQSAAAFDNPDFVDVVVHSYRHRFGLVPGDPRFDATEALLAQQPPILVPAVVLEGADDGVAPPLEQDRKRDLFGARYERRLIPGVGHNIPQEAPQAFAEAIASLLPAAV